MSSHREIFKVTAVIGGTQFITLGFGILRNKALALLLGPSGVGLASLYTSAVAFIGDMSGLGISSSGVRQIAATAAGEDPSRLNRTIVTLRYTSLLCGIVGMIVAAVLAPQLSMAMFGDLSHRWSVTAMAVTLFFGALSAGQTAILQGLRHLRELALFQIFSSILGTLACLGFILLFRESGIVPYLVASSFLALCFSSWYTRRFVWVERVPPKEILMEAGNLVKMGVAFTFSALLTGFVAYWTRIEIQRAIGTAAVGIFTATWTLSSYYVGFVLSAMGTDLVRRLAAAADDNVSVNRLVNEQTETGLLIALPGVVATITLAPWVLITFYSKDFVLGDATVRWQILGVFLRLLSWPLVYVLIARGASLWYAITEAVSWVFYLIVFHFCVGRWQLEGAGIAFLGLYIFSTVMLTALIAAQTGFRWTSQVFSIFLTSALFIGLALAGLLTLPSPWSTISGLAVTSAAGIYSVRKLEGLLGVSSVRWLFIKLFRKR